MTESISETNNFKPQESLTYIDSNKSIKEPITPEKALIMLQDEKNGNEIFLGSEKWSDAHTPNPNSHLEDTKTEFIRKYKGITNYHIRTYEDPENFQAPFYQLVVQTGLENIFLTQTYYPSEGLSMLTVRQGEPKLLPSVPKQIDISANFMRGILKQEYIQSVSPESYQKEFVDCVKDLHWISLDADDCLLSTTNNIEPQDISELKKFSDLTRNLDNQGVQLFLNTGRGVADTIKTISMVENLGGVINHAVCENGSVIYNRLQNSWEADPKIPKEAIILKDCLFQFLNQNLSETTIENGQPITRKLGSFESGKVIGISINKTDEGVIKAKREIKPEDIDSNLKPEDIKDIDLYREWIKKIIRNNKDQIISDTVKNTDKEGLKLNPQSAEVILEAIVSQIKNSSTAVDINPSMLVDGKYVGITKKRGTFVFAEKMGIIHIGRKPNEKIQGILGIGDSGGDLPTLEEVDSALPWNATIDLRNNPKVNVVYYSPYSMTKGVNDILESVKNIKTKVNNTK